MAQPNPQSHVAIVDLGPALRFDSSANPILYLGLAATGSGEGESVWQITQIDVTSGVAFRYPNGDSGYNFIWSLRAMLSYR